MFGEMVWISIRKIKVIKIFVLNLNAGIQNDMLVILYVG